MRHRRLFPKGQQFKSFYSSFDDISEFNGYYIVPPGTYGTTHRLDASDKYHGTHCHHAQILTANDVDNESTPTYVPHRGYPTVQMYKTGSFTGPCLISLYVKVNITLQVRAGVDDWLSLLTTTPDTTDDWVRTVLCNFTPDGYLRLVHVPNQGEQTHIYQISSSQDPSGVLQMPLNTWFRLDMFIDFSESGRAAIWQNKVRISEALVSGGTGALNQYHGGLYAAAAVSSGWVKNDKLRIVMVRDYDHALSLVNDNH